MWRKMNPLVFCIIISDVIKDGLHLIQKMFILFLKAMREIHVTKRSRKPPGAICKQDLVQSYRIGVVDV